MWSFLFISFFAVFFSRPPRLSFAFSAMHATRNVQKVRNTHIHAHTHTNSYVKEKKILIQEWTL